MKRFLAGMVIIALVLTQAIGGIPVLAAGPANVTPATPAPKLSVIKGIVKSVGANSITVNDATVSVGNFTKVTIPGIKGAKVTDITAGMNVVIQPRSVDGVLRAAAISVVEVIRHVVGNVTAYNYDPSAGGSISLQTKSGTDTFHIVAGAFEIQPKGTAVQVGDHATVVTRSLTATDAPVAFGIVISPHLEHVAGNVTAFNYEQGKGGSISIEVKGGTILTFNILSGRFSVQPAGAAVNVGEHVIVTVQVEPAGSQSAIGVEVILPVQHFAGNVTEFRYEPNNGGKISIMQKDGKRLNFDIKAGQFTVRPTGATIQVGDVVTVAARVEEGNHVVAIGAAIHPKAVTVKGTISNVNEAGKTITIGNMVVSYNDSTVVVLHGTLAVRVGLQATATCIQQPDHSLLARSISLTLP